MPNTIRVTMFKVGGPATNIDRILELYKILAKTAVKDSKPYILSLQAGRAHPDPRSQGFNLIAKTEFATLEDMRFYDAGCAAHARLREEVRSWEGVVEGMMTVYYEAEVVGGGGI